MPRHSGGPPIWLFVIGAIFVWGLLNSTTPTTVSVPMAPSTQLNESQQYVPQPINYTRNATSKTGTFDVSNLNNEDISNMEILK
jgi:hypothetical protein